MVIPLGSTTNISRYSEMQTPSRSCVNPGYRPSRFKRGAKPHNLGCRRPQFKHCSSLTPTRFPQEGQTTEPHFCLNMGSLCGQIEEICGELQISDPDRAVA